MMQFSVLGSGSKGNCVFIAYKNTAFLIDGGFSGKAIEQRLKSIDRDIGSLDAIFVTHEHHDHISGVGVLSRRCRIPVFANEGTYRGAAQRLSKLFEQRGFDTGDSICFQDLQIRSFPVSHDTDDPVGYVISNGNSKLGYCTDTGMVTNLVSQRLGGLDSLILEFNHDPELLKNGPYPPALQQRVRSNKGHLANVDSAKLLKTIVHRRMQHVVLAHLSETNNLPELAFEEARAVIPREIPNNIIKISKQDQPTSLFEII